MKTVGKWRKGVSDDRVKEVKNCKVASADTSCGVGVGTEDNMNVNVRIDEFRFSADF